VREKNIINKGRCCEASSKAQRGLFFSGIYHSIDQLFVSSFCQKGEEEEGGEYVKDKRGRGMMIKGTLEKMQGNEQYYRR
jgi:hypothetical protein